MRISSEQTIADQFYIYIYKLFLCGYVYNFFFINVALLSFTKPTTLIKGQWHPKQKKIAINATDPDRSHFLSWYVYSLRLP